MTDPTIDAERLAASERYATTIGDETGWMMSVSDGTRIPADKRAPAILAEIGEAQRELREAVAS
jgi:hypothetical protein